MNIITLTPNPAIDIHLACDSFKMGGYNSSRELSRESAGKGVNVSRALAENGIPNICYIMLGKERAESYLAPLADYNMTVKCSFTDGACRENINIHHRGSETVIAGDGPKVTRENVDAFLKSLKQYSGEGTYLVLSGSISSASDKDAILEALFKLSASGVSIIVDTKSYSLEEIIPLRPYLIKPNEEEAELLTGLSVKTDEDAIAAAKAMLDMGIQNVLLTRGDAKTVLAADDGIYLAEPPRVKVASTVGAGDSTVAGFLFGIYRGYDTEECLRSAVAFGTAACTTEGTLPPPTCQVNAIKPRVKITKVE